jgi:hypothetical protein
MPPLTLKTGLKTAKNARNSLTTVLDSTVIICRQKLANAEIYFKELI